MSSVILMDSIRLFGSLLDSVIVLFMFSGIDSATLIY